MEVGVCGKSLYALEGMFSGMSVDWLIDLPHIRDPLREPASAQPEDGRMFKVNKRHHSLYEEQLL